jgi:hypothetical protein
MNSWIDALSGGDRKMVELARAQEQTYGGGFSPYPAMLTVCALADLLDLYDGQEVPDTTPWDRVIIDELAHNYSCPGLLANGWWQRRLDQIDKITIHHTYGWVDVYSFAEAYIRKEGGRPSVPYTVWVTGTGEVLLCNSLTDGCWHDHTGHKNTHLSIGLVGELHKHTPHNMQLTSAAKVCKWVIDNEDIPLVTKASDVTGHMDWTATACPGWLDTGEGKPSGLWKPNFYNILEDMLS